MSSTPPPASREGILLANSGESYHRWTPVSSFIIFLPTLKTFVKLNQKMGIAE